ncbi:MAG: WYL domain-containing protein [Faecousia sp.]|nr:WYL domain-containing protein [Bacillota bacterium]
MDTLKPKKPLLLILEILRKYTDENHRLSQKDIGDILKNEYGLKIDRITGIRLLDTPRKPMKLVPELKNGLYLPKHIAEHLYMFSGESVPVTFRMKKQILNDVIDWFGTEITFSDETEDEVTVNWHAMHHRALQYCRHVRILEPADLVAVVRSDLQSANNSYSCVYEQEKD